MAERVHAIVSFAAPCKKQTTFPSFAQAGMPYQVRGARPGAAFKARYATIGFSDKANLDDGNMWATAFALT
jgi:uncharacterized protein YdhG (YjbR/CyaY superfamily)